MLRSSWIASELLTTFTQEHKLASVSLIPKSPPLSPGGIFRVVSRDETESERVLWDRSVEGRFPEAKEVKQAVRDVVNPDKDLGHSDKKDVESTQVKVDCVECKEKEDAVNASTAIDPTVQTVQVVPSAFHDTNIISIEYSTGPTIYSPDNKMHTAMYYTNELLTMVYERNAWWKERKDTQLDSMSDSDVPAAIDGVRLIPIRGDVGVFVSSTLFDLAPFLETFLSNSIPNHSNNTF
jgi:selenoprotein W-related protein